jgi:DUF4097 and DUF4098 domain-containing protein YvlB
MIAEASGLGVGEHREVLEEIVMGMNNLMKVAMSGFLALAIAGGIAAAKEWELTRTEKITVDGVSGDVRIRRGENTEGLVELRGDVNPPEAFKPKVVQNRTSLNISEEWGRGNSSGNVEWLITLPRDTESSVIRMDSSSGSLDWEGIDAQMKFKSSSGDVKLANASVGPGAEFRTSSGDFIIDRVTLQEDGRLETSSGDLELHQVQVAEGVKLSTSSGDIDCTECSGYLDLDTSSGSIVVKDSMPDGASRFSSSSGSVSLYLANLPHEDLSASSSSGTVTFDVQDYGDNYTLILTRREDKGRIISPFKPTGTRTFSRNGQPYEEVSIEHGTGGPVITLSTASGTVRVTD